MSQFQYANTGLLVPSRLAPARRFDMFYDFCVPYTNDAAPDFAATVSSGSVSRLADEDNHPGIINLSTTTSATGSALLYRASVNTSAAPCYYLSANEVLNFETLVRLNAAPSGTETFSTRIGLRDVNTNANVVWAQAYWTGAAAKWAIVTNKGGAGATTTDSTATPTTAWTHIRLAITTASVTLWVDGANVGSYSGTNIPLASAGMGELFGIVKTVGTTARTMDVDFSWVWKTYSSPRNPYISQPY